MTEKIPFRLAAGQQPLMLVPVHVNGVGPYSFIFDTGANNCLVSRQVADAASISQTGTRDGHTAGGKVTVGTGRADAIRLGKTELADIEVGITDFADLERAIGCKIDGDLGYNFFGKFRLTIDYKSNELSLRSGGVESIGAVAVTEVSFELAAPAKPLVVVDTFVNGRGPLKFAIDTGTSTTLVSNDLARKLSLSLQPMPSISTGGGHSAAASATMVDSIVVGGARQANLPILSAGVLEMLNQVIGSNLDGILGYNFLRNYKFTIDYTNRTVMFSE